MVNVLFSLIDFLFSARGRIRRLPYWGYYIGITMLWVVISVSLVMTFFGPVNDRVMAGETPEIAMQSLDADETNLFLVLFLLLGLAYTWSTYAVTARRWHDRDKSGWWSLIGFVPFIGGIWIFVECGCLPGTRGPNRYGDAPGSSEGNLAKVFE